jgi:hypothetical protein
MPLFDSEISSLSMPARRRLTESMSMSAPIIEAEMSMKSMSLLDSEIYPFAYANSLTIEMKKLPLAF